VVWKQLVINLSNLIHNEYSSQSAVLFGCRTVLPYCLEERITASASLLALTADRPVPGHKGI
jgi:hypothetical protein